MGDEAHHAIKVARRRAGERVYLIDGFGKGYEAEIVSTGGMIVRCEIVRELPGWGEPEIDVTLAVAPTKGGRFDHCGGEGRRAWRRRRTAAGDGPLGGP